VEGQWVCYCSQASGNQGLVKRKIELAKTDEGKFVSYVPEKNTQEAEV